MLFTLLVAAPAFAQPAPTPAPQPAPPDQPQPPPPDQPSWLPGVQDVTASEVATPGKLTLSMERAVELALKQNPTARQARANADAAAGRVESARVIAAPDGQPQRLARHRELGRAPVRVRPDDDLRRVLRSERDDRRVGDRELAHHRLRADPREHRRRAGQRRGRERRHRHELARHPHRRRARVPRGARARPARAGRRRRPSRARRVTSIRRSGSSRRRPTIRSRSQQASSRAANARSSLAQAQSNEAVALANLRAAIGWLDPSRSPAVDPRWPVPSDAEPPDLPALVDTARKNRPEIVAADKQIAAADASLEAAHYERRPILSANASALYAPHTGDWSPQPSWAAGLTLSWFLYDGGRSRADVHVATREPRVGDRLARRAARLADLGARGVARADRREPRERRRRRPRPSPPRRPSSSSPRRATPRASAARSSSPTRRPR